MRKIIAPMNNKSSAAQAPLQREFAAAINSNPSPTGVPGAAASQARSALLPTSFGRGSEQPVSPRVSDEGRAVDAIGLDVPALAAALSRRLYAAGVPVTPDRAVNFARAVTLVSPVSRGELYHTARAVFVSAPAHVPAFDRVFACVFDGSPSAVSGSRRAG